MSELKWKRACDSSACVEVAWTGCEGGHCPEVAHCCGDVLVRDGKLGASSPVLRFNSEEWLAFRAAVAAGVFDLEEVNR